MKSRLSLSTYQPNVNDPRVRKKLSELLKWAQKLRLTKKARPINHAVLREVFGNTARPGLAQWARSNLLIQVGAYQIGKMPFQYRLNESGYLKITQMLQEEPKTEEDAAIEEYGRIAQGTEEITYEDTGGRRYHHVQNLPKELRRSTFFGWFDYDIEASAPTLIYQYAAAHWRWVSKLEVEEAPFGAVRDLIENKRRVREHIAALAGVPVEDAKRILATLFFQGNLAPYGKATLFRLLGQDHERHGALLADTWVRRFITDVKSMWQYALWRQSREQTINLLKRLAVDGPSQADAARELALASGPYASLYRSKRSQRRQALYVRLEREVMNAMLVMLGFPKPGLVLMHDGFMSKDQVDRMALEEHVREVTGYVVKISESKIAGSGEEEMDWIEQGDEEEGHEEEGGVEKSE